MTAVANAGETQGAGRRVRPARARGAHPGAPGARSGRRHRPRRPARPGPHAAATMVVDLQALGLDAHHGHRRRRPRRRHRHARRPSRPATSWSLGGASARPPRRRPRRCCATRAPSAATSASTRAAGTTAASSGTAGWRRRHLLRADRRAPKHNLQAGDCISAHPSDLAPALLACRASVHLQSAHGERELRLAHLYRRPTEQNRSLIDLDVGRDRDRRRAAGAARCLRVPAPRRAARLLVPARQRGRRAVRRRAAWWRRAASPTSRSSSTPPTAGGAAGQPESAWKRTVVETLVARGLEAIGA